MVKPLAQTPAAVLSIKPKTAEANQTTKVTEIAKGAFTILTKPGFFSSTEFYQGAEIVLGTISGVSAIGTVLYYFAGKPDCSGLSGILFITSASSAHFAGQVALSKSLQEKLEKMEGLNNQQAAQLAHFQTLFNEFKKNIGEFKEFNEQNQEELSSAIEKFQQQIQSSHHLLQKLFKDEESLQALLKAIKEIKDPETFFRRMNELELVTKKLQDSQRDLAATEARLAETDARLAVVVENLRQSEIEQKHILSEHRKVLSAHAAETNKLQAVVSSFI
ncbi:MAG TPA: hypothetical protein VLE96_06320 [Chlamydiales bacterium]|nr:hypothetical protein [Chlamydiales bacterium]